MRSILALAAVALALGASLSTASAQKGANLNPGIAPPNSSTHGMTYGEWAGAWWNWALRYPEAECPVLDPDGSLTMLHQSGPVVFLAGTFGGFAERSITIEPGKSILVAIGNYVDWYPDDGLTEDILRAKAHANIAEFTALTCRIDGRLVVNPWAYRAESPAGGFALEIPAGSVLDQWGAITPGTHTPSIADGFWLMLTPLAPGQHTIQTLAVKPTWTVEVIYHITVLPPGKSK